MTTPNTHAQIVADAKAFQREERFIVIKRKRLTQMDEDYLRYWLRWNKIPTAECIVVESDWPEYETVWQMIEARCTGKPLLDIATRATQAPANEPDGQGDLLPCPFCGGQAELRDDGFEVHCATGCTARVNDDYRPAAIAAWNTRLSTPAPSQQGEPDPDCEYCFGSGAVETGGDEAHTAFSVACLCTATEAELAALRSSSPTGDVSEILEAGYARAMQSSPGFRVKILSETIIAALAKHGGGKC